MRIETNAANRKEVVKAVSGILGQPSKYMGVPTCAYQIGNCTIDKSGAVETEDEKTAELVTAGLTEQGFIGNPEPEADGATVSLPVEGMTAEGFRNLIYLLHSKQYLIGRAFAEEVFRIPAALVEEFGGAELPDAEAFLQVFQKHAGECKGIGFLDGKVAFTLPAINDPDMVLAFTHLAAAMAKQAREQKRIRPDETIEENEKYYMRIWLLRLGFGGAEGKEVRNLLLKNLKGNAAFRTEENKERWKEARRIEKEAARQAEQASAETSGQPEEMAGQQEAEVQEGQDSGTEE
ncbi:MAG: hypothetical protein NC305_13470 [Lachnospiraceae bacterium]|nr:hypothetical protein [Lachnospiraceae bacterium]